MRRPNGAGTVVQRMDGRWAGQISIRTGPGQRRRLTVYGWTADEVERKLDEARADAGIPVKERHTPALRRQREQAARASGTHTPREWGDLKRAVGHRCYYCGALCVRKPTKDHVVPISRGGSDCIANIVLACHPCNSAKGAMTLVEFLSVKSREERHAEYRAGAVSRGRLAGDNIPRGR